MNKARLINIVHNFYSDIFFGGMDYTVSTSEFSVVIADVTVSVLSE